MSKRKLVLEEHENSVLVGIMQEGCDPVIRTVEGSLDEALAYIPKLLGQAQEEWAVSPKKPAYTPPVAPKPVPAPAAAATPAQKAEDLPLLSGTEKAKPAEEKAELEGRIKEAMAALPVYQEFLNGRASTDELAMEFIKTPEGQTFLKKVEQEFPAEIRREAEAVATEVANAKPGEWEYYLQDGRGPFESVQAAMDELGLDKNTRPMHNRWDRLSTALKEKIQRRP